MEFNFFLFFFQFTNVKKKMYDENDLNFFEEDEQEEQIEKKQEIKKENNDESMEKELINQIGEFLPFFPTFFNYINTPPHHSSSLYMMNRKIME